MNNNGVLMDGGGKRALETDTRVKYRAEHMAMKQCTVVEIKMEEPTARIASYFT